MLLLNPWVFLDQCQYLNQSTNLLFEAIWTASYILRSFFIILSWNLLDCLWRIQLNINLLKVTMNLLLNYTWLMPYLSLRWLFVSLMLKFMLLICWISYPVRIIHDAIFIYFQNMILVLVFLLLVMGLIMIKFCMLLC